MGYELKVDGMTEISETLSKLEEKAPAVAAKALYEGAGIMASGKARIRYRPRLLSGLQVLPELPGFHLLKRRRLFRRLPPVLRSSIRTARKYRLRSVSGMPDTRS